MKNFMKSIFADFSLHERAVFVWGFTVSLAYLITYFYADFAIYAWIIVLVINTVNHIEMSGFDLNLNSFWIIAAFSIFFFDGYFDLEIILLVLGSLGFYYTSMKTEEAASRLYYTASLLNIATLLLYLFRSGQVEIYLLLAFVQGGPMLIDFFAE